MNILDELIAKGVSSEVIIAVANLISEHEQIEKRRANNRDRMQTVRARAHTSMHTETQTSPLSLVSKKETLSKERKGVRGKPIAIPLPDDWQPKGPQRDPTEPDEFRDMCRSKGRTYVDFDAAYRQFQRSPYNPRNKTGAAVPIVKKTQAEITAEVHRKVAEEQARIAKEGTDGKAEAAGLRRHPDVGQNGSGNAGELRLAGGMDHVAGVEGGQLGALISATSRQMRRG